MNKEKWLFQIFWGEGYSNINSLGEEKEHCLMSIVWLDYFTEENGYNQYTIDKTKELKVGESFMNTDSGIHSIVRIR